MNKANQRFLRLLHLLLSTQKSRGLRPRDMAERLECSLRTVYRDLERLSYLVPLYQEEGYKVLPGILLPPIPLTFEEVLSILHCCGAKEARKTPVSATMAGVAKKIEETLTNGFFATDSKLKEKVAGVPGPRKAGPKGDGLLRSRIHQPLRTTIGVLEQALTRRLQTRITFSPEETGSTPRARQEVSIELVEPYGLFYQKCNWYLVAHFPKTSKIVVLKGDRIQKIQLLATPSRRPRNFSIEEYVERTWNASLSQPVHPNGPVAHSRRSRSRHS
ncbi:MAG: WYL domain-containing protein [Armatimonadetes bacterium]|nr:WYL domain-containing protein [Armatimonadota bacterium]